MTAVRRTPLYEAHVRLGARMVDFAGYAMPVQYTSIISEHEAVRKHAGLFDVSHMGQIEFEGPAAISTAERLLSRPIESLRTGGVRYALLCNDHGGVVDDVTVYRTGEQSLMLCVNAANIEKDFSWVVEHAPENAAIRNASDETGLLALQGPASQSILADLTPTDLEDLRRYRFTTGPVADRKAMISRTGYTGSDGFEIYVRASDLEEVFEALLERGASKGLEPAGLGARDTLRLEAGMPLYGHELDDDTSPLEAGLGRFVEPKPEGFLGSNAIEQLRANGLSRQLVGFEVDGKGVARAGYEVEKSGKIIGSVTSGSPSPSLGKSIGMAYVSTEHARVDTSLDIVIRGRRVAAHVVDIPFVPTPGRTRAKAPPP
ncbi:glycine cleavage system aminomethyltransferase GcvT [Myxococcota bacterium]|nr:glycine cleavage system aminomethyltransferase GcvT [Myxococcota bacterium]